MKELTFEKNQDQKNLDFVTSFLINQIDDLKEQKLHLIKNVTLDSEIMEEVLSELEILDSKIEEHLYCLNREIDRISSIIEDIKRNKKFNSTRRNIIHILILHIEYFKNGNDLIRLKSRPNNYEKILLTDINHTIATGKATSTIEELTYKLDGEYNWQNLISNLEFAVKSISDGSIASVQEVCTLLEKLILKKP